jgi:hypothetical protein
MKVMLAKVTANWLNVKDAFMGFDANRDGCLTAK